MNVKFLKRFLCLALGLMLLMGFVSAGAAATEGPPETAEGTAATANSIASGTCGENLTWTLTEDGTLTISGTGAIDHYYREYDVPWYSRRVSVTSVVIEDGVTSISDYAFYGCTSLTDVTIGSGVTSIGCFTFEDCTSLTDIVIPDSVTSIGFYAFHGCTSLTDVTIGSGVTSIGYCTFKGCTSLTDVTIGSGVTIIGGSAFLGCTSLTSIEIPDSVTSIYESAFYGCTSLTDVTIGSGVTSIDDQAFYNCTSLTEIWFEGDAPDIHSRGFWRVTATAYYPAGNATWTSDKLKNYYGTLTWVAYEKEEPDENIIASGTCGENLTWVLTEDGTLTISGTGAMYNSYPEPNVPWYSSRASVTSVVIEDGVTSIGMLAFIKCTSLTGIVIPDSVTSIGFQAFYNCTSLTEIWFEGDAPSMGENVFAGVTATAHYPAGNATWTADKLQNYGGNLTWIPSHSEEPTHIPGDITGDGVVNNKDLTRLFRHLSGFDVEVNQAALDVTGDGAVNNKDVTRLFRYLSGYEVEIH